MATDGTSNTLLVSEVVQTKDIAIYNGFEVVNTTSLDDGGDVDGRDFLAWQRGSSAQINELNGISENINQSGAQYQNIVDESRPRKSAQDDKWSFCLTAGTL